MRTLTTINWVRDQLAHTGAPVGTTHTGTRGSWSFRITTPRNGLPLLTALCGDGRKVQQEHQSLRAAKTAALNLLHPAERMGWNAGQGSGPVLYRAQWDNLVFAVFQPFSVGDDLGFQWRDTKAEWRSTPVVVSGIREARQLAAAVLRDHYPTETPAGASKAADGPREALAAALEAAGIVFTPEQLDLAATALVVQRARP